MKRISILLCIIIVMTMFVGCQASSNKPLIPDQNPTDNAQQQSINNNQAMIDSITRMAEEVQGVKNASVAISDTSDTSTDGIGIINNNPGQNYSTNYNNGNNPNSNQVDNSINNNKPLANREPLGTKAIDFQSDGYRSNAKGNPKNLNNQNDYINSRGNLVVMVGLELDDNQKDTNTTKIKNMVEQKIKNSDNRISKVMVTSDAGMVKQINDVNNAIKNGTPVKSIQRNIDNLINRLTSK